MMMAKKACLVFLLAMAVSAFAPPRYCHAVPSALRNNPALAAPKVPSLLQANKNKNDPAESSSVSTKERLQEVADVVTTEEEKKHGKSVVQRVKSLFLRKKAKSDQGSSSVVVSSTLQQEEKRPNEEVVASTTEGDDTKNLLQQVKNAGLAGTISYALWELGFWCVSVPVVLFSYMEVTGHWPDLSDKDDIAKLTAEAFAFVNFARFAVPLRIGLALSTTPWIQENIVDRFLINKKEDDGTAANGASGANGSNETTGE